MSVSVDLAGANFDWDLDFANWGHAKPHRQTGEVAFISIFKKFIEQVAISAAAIASLNGLAPAAGSVAIGNAAGTAWVRSSGSGVTAKLDGLSISGKIGILGLGALPAANALEIGTNGAGSRWKYNVPTGGEHDFDVNGTTAFYVYGGGAGVLGGLNFFTDVSGGYWMSGPGSFGVGMWNNGGTLTWRAGGSDKMTLSGGGALTVANGITVSGGNLTVPANGMITNAASGYMIVAANGGALYLRAGTASGSIFMQDSAGNAATVGIGTTVTTGAGPGAVVLANNTPLCGLNAAGNTATSLVWRDSSDRLSLQALSTRLRIDNGYTTTSAPTNGAAAALTANPRFYLLLNVDGVDVGVPCYTL